MIGTISLLSSIKVKIHTVMSYGQISILIRCKEQNKFYIPITNIQIPVLFFIVMLRKHVMKYSL